MPLWGLLGIIDVLKQNAKEKKLRELLLEKGYPQDFTKFAVWSTGYMWLSENDKEEVYKKIDITREVLETRINNAYIVMLQHEDIANLLIGNRKKAKEANQEALSILARMKEK
jgi:hypothetical protein